MPYSIIYADPPWAYRDKCRSGNRGAAYKYRTMDMEALIDMRPMIDHLADRDCTLFLWATYPFLGEAHQLFHHWGFTYKTAAFTWLKTTRKSGKEHLGMGNWTRANAETCLLGIRGKPKRINAGVRSTVIAPLREHSRKPEEVRRRIVQLLGPLPRIELFARECAEGWETWGDEAPGGLKIPVPPPLVASPPVGYPGMCA